MSPAIRLLVLALVIAAVLVARPVLAVPLIRDAEIEDTLERIAEPVLVAADLSPAIVNIYIVNDDEPNAFVAGGQNIFLHAGMLMRLATIGQLRSVIAHEAGHIAGGHLTRRGDALRGARGVAAIGMLGAAAATIAGSPEAGIALVTGSGSAAQRRLFDHSRAEEAAADQMALRYMAATGTDPDEMLDVLDQFRGRDLQRSLTADRYTRTHPLWSDRIRLIRENVASLPDGRPPDAEDVYWHRRMVAKLEGFLRPPGDILDDYPPPEDPDEPARLARAIALHRLPDPDAAITAIDDLIAYRPEDPYYHELKGQFLLESGYAGRAAEAYRRAVELDPLEPQILGGLGRALLNVDTPESDEEAREMLALSARYDKANAGVLRDLALAEARLGNEGAAALATAERFLLTGQPQDAARNAARAADLLAEGSPGWRQAQDVLVVVRRTRERTIR